MNCCVYIRQTSTLMCPSLPPSLPLSRRWSPRWALATGFWSQYETCWTAAVPCWWTPTAWHYSWKGKSPGGKYLSQCWIWRAGSSISTINGGILVSPWSQALCIVYMNTCKVAIELQIIRTCNRKLYMAM